MIVSKAQIAVELANEIPAKTASPFPGYAMNARTPGGGGTLARQQLGKEAKSDQMKAEAPLLRIALNNPIENPVQGFAGQGYRKHFIQGWMIDAARRIIDVSIRGNIARQDHDDFAFLRMI